MLNIENTFEYKYNGKEYAEFTDQEGYDFFVRLVPPHFELKMGWKDLEGQKRYLRQPSREIDVRRANTVAKIYKLHLLPFFLEQTLSDVMLVKPLDSKRYQFSIRMLRKFNNDKEIEIIEDYPTQIQLIKKNSNATPNIVHSPYEK